MKSITPTLLLLSLCGLNACSHLITGKMVGYPDGGEPNTSCTNRMFGSVTSLYTETAYVQFRGANWQSFTDRTKKHFYVFITKNGADQVFGPYQLVAADLDCDITWAESGKKVIIDIFELPVGVTEYDKNAHDLRIKRLTLEFAYDQSVDRFSPVAQ